MPQAMGFGSFWWRVTACHMATYFVAGMLAYTLLDYRQLFETGVLAALMRPMDSPWVALGPALQPLRGIVLAVVLWPFRRVFLEEPHGWLKLWGLLAGLTILSTSGASIGSIEGVIYTKVPVADQLRGWPEVMGQTLASAALLVAWCRRPGKWWNIGMGLSVVLIIAMSVMGAMMPRPAAFG